VGKHGRARHVTDDDIVRRWPFACWINKAKKHTFKICNTYWFPKAKMVMRTHLSITLYVHCLLIVFAFVC